MKKKDIIIGIIIAVILAFLFSPFASPSPDGLERVAENKGFLEKGEEEPSLASPIPDYVFPGLSNEKLATSIAGVSGTLLMFGIGYGVALLLKKRKTTE
jgi:cobalt/nickel transport protein